MVDAIGLRIGKCHYAHGPTVGLSNAILQNGEIGAKGGRGIGIVDGGPLVSVVAGNAVIAIKAARKRRVEGKRRRKKLRKVWVLRCQLQASRYKKCKK
jgi:hypothetical protein